MGSDLASDLEGDSEEARNLRSQLRTGVGVVNQGHGQVRARGVSRDEPAGPVNERMRRMSDTSSSGHGDDTTVTS